jgi:glutaredoxin
MITNNEMIENKGMNGKIGVRLLTLDYCDTCQWLKSELDAAGISYVNIDAEQFSDFADEIEDKFKTFTYPIVFLDLGDKVITILPETDLVTTDTLRTFNTVPQLVSTIKQIIK